MDRTDLTLLWVVIALGLLAAVLRPALARRRGQPPSVLWTVQGFLFPAILLAVLVLSVTGTADLVFPGVLLALGEELLCGLIRRRTEQKPN